VCARIQPTEPVKSAPFARAEKEAGKNQDGQVCRHHVADAADQTEDGSGHRHATSTALIGKPSRDWGGEHGGQRSNRHRQAGGDLMLRITTGWPERLLEQLRGSEIDVAAFCLPDGLDPPTEIEADALDIQPLFVAASRSLDLPSPATLQDLAPLPWIINQDGCGFRSAIQRRFEQEHLSLRIGIEALSSDLRLSLVARGLGITLATRAAIESSPLRDALQVIPVQDFEPRVRAWIVRRPPVGRLVKPIECLTSALEAAIDAQVPSQIRADARTCTTTAKNCSAEPGN
jgi:DNA-binding transcriptional LysR family regulator